MGTGRHRSVLVLEACWILQFLFILLALLQTIFKIKGLFFSIFKNVFDRETGEIFLEACPNNKRDKVFAWYGNSVSFYSCFFSSLCIFINFSILCYNFRTHWKRSYCAVLDLALTSSRTAGGGTLDSEKRVIFVKYLTYYLFS